MAPLAERMPLGHPARAEIKVKIKIKSLFSI
jgi:hypothetical protein